VSTENNGYLDARLSIVKNGKEKKKKEIEIQPRCSQVIFKREKIVPRRIGIRHLSLSYIYFHPSYTSPTFTSFSTYHQILFTTPHTCTT
jgi:hypothetical protein